MFHHQNDLRYNQNRMNVNKESKKKIEIILIRNEKFLPVEDQHNNSDKAYK